MSAPRWLRSLALVGLALGAGGCDDWIEHAYVDPPVPPATAPARSSTSAIEVTEGTASRVVLWQFDQSGFAMKDRVKAVTRVRSRDERTARVASTMDRAPLGTDRDHDLSGPVFLVVGVAPGDAVLDVEVGGEHVGTAEVHVLAQ